LKKAGPWRFYTSPQPPGSLFTLGVVMKKLVLCLMVAWLMPLSAADKNWVGFDEGLKLAKEQNKQVLIDFYTDWCHWCKVMDEKTFSNETVANKLKAGFITVRLNAESKTETATYMGNTYTNVQLTQAFGVTGFPTLAFLEPDGGLITKIPGYVPADKFLNVLDYIDAQCYSKDVTFEEFLEKGDCKE